MSKETKPKLSKIDLLLERKNNKFNKASRSEKKMLVLKDALKFSQIPGVDIAQGDYGTIKDFDTAKSLQKHLLKDRVRCQVCARGALLCSRVRLGNQFSIKGLSPWLSGSETLEALKGIFTEKEMLIFEDVFECSNVQYNRLTKGTLRLLEKANYIARYGGTREFVEKNYSDDASIRFTQTVQNVIWAKGNVEKGIFRALYEKKEKTVKKKK